jgi:hypothetical protein
MHILRRMYFRILWPTDRGGQTFSRSHAIDGLIQMPRSVVE